MQQNRHTKEKPTDVDRQHKPMQGEQKNQNKWEADGAKEAPKHRRFGKSCNKLSP